MKKIYICLCIALGILKANQYDYLLFSNVLSDVQSGLNLKADVNARWRGNTPLYTAVKNNSLESAYLLIMSGADVNALNNGVTALHEAVRNKNNYMVQLLIAAGAKVNTQDENNGNTALHYAALNNDRQMLNILANMQGDMNISNFQGTTPTQIAMTGIIIPPIIIEDSNLAISASAFKITQSNVVFNIRNLTNEPLIIRNTIAYLNGKFIGGNQKPLIIPAGTTITNVNMLTIGTSGIHILKVDKEGQVDVKAGFSIDYEAEGRIQRAFNSINMKLKLWDVAPKKQVKSQDSNE